MLHASIDITSSLQTYSYHTRAQLYTVAICTLAITMILMFSPPISLSCLKDKFSHLTQENPVVRKKLWYTNCQCYKKKNCYSMIVRLVRPIILGYNRLKKHIKRCKIIGPVCWYGSLDMVGQQPLMYLIKQCSELSKFLSLVMGLTPGNLKAMCIYSSVLFHWQILSSYKCQQHGL